MSDDIMHDNSSPPPMPRALTQSGSEWAAVKAAESKALSRQAITIATEARDVGKRIEQLIGQSPDPARKVEGSGLLGGVALILDRLETIETREGLRALERARWGAAWRVVAGAIGLVATVIGIVKAVGH